MTANYHELTMSEAHDSPARRKQFLVICTVMAGVFCYSFLSSGGLSSVEFMEGDCPPGELTFKRAKRDYAAAPGLARSIGKELDMKVPQFADTLYTLYLDDPTAVTGGRQQRFAVGLLSKKGDERRKTLLAKNDAIKPATKSDEMELSAGELWKKIKYESASLPKTKCAVVQFPFTNGFVSALILSYKVLPKIHKYVEKNGKGPVVVLSTCSVDDSMCTHYAPLTNSKPFLLGQPDTKAYAASLEPEPFIDFEAIKSTLSKIVPFYKYFAGSSSTSDEL